METVKSSPCVKYPAFGFSKTATTKRTWTFGGLVFLKRQLLKGLEHLEEGRAVRALALWIWSLKSEDLKLPLEEREAAGSKHETVKQG